MATIAALPTLHIDQLEPIGVVARFGLEERSVARGVEVAGGMHRDERLAGEVIRERGVELGDRRRDRERDVDEHAARERADRGREQRRAREPAVLLHLRDVLVGEREAVGAESRRAASLVHLDHLRTAAGVARDRVHGEGGIAGDQLALAERPHEREEAGRIAARIRDAASAGELGPGRARQLGEPVRPGGAMRGAGVEHARRAVDQPDGLARGVVGQAQDHEVDLVHDRALRRRILRAVARQADELDVVARGEALPDLEPGRPVLAIDVDRRPRHRAPLYRVAPREARARPMLRCGMATPDNPYRVGAEPTQQLIVTTGNDVAGLRSTMYLASVRGSVVRSPSCGKTFIGAFRTLGGGNIKEFTEVCETGRHEAYQQMIEHALERGADAIIGMRYDATEFVQGTTEVLAYGTAVRIEPTAGY